MQFIKEITFDISRDLIQRIEAKQNDTKSRFIIFNLINNNTPLDLTSNTVKIFAQKADTTIIFNNVIILDATNGKIQVELTSQTLAIAGDLNCELDIYGSDSSIFSSTVFTINVEVGIRNDTAIESTNEFTALTTALSSVSLYDSRLNNLKNIQLYTSTSSVSSIPLNTGNIDLTQCTIDVFYEGCLLELGTEYSINTTNKTISLIGWSLDVAEKIKYRIYM